MYIFGGRNFKTRVFASKVHVYNDETNSWSELPVTVGGPPDEAAGSTAAGHGAVDGAEDMVEDMDEGSTDGGMGSSGVGAGSGANVMRFHSYTERVPTRTGHAAAPHRNGMVFFGGMSERSDRSQHFLNDMILLDMF
jgi:hypothetical protein